MMVLGRSAGSQQCCRITGTGIRGAAKLTYRQGRSAVRIRFVVLACLWVAAGFASPPAWAEDDFYKGKQLRLVVSTDAGGAYDTYARLLAKTLKEHIPGDP